MMRSTCAGHQSTTTGSVLAWLLIPAFVLASATCGRNELSRTEAEKRIQESSFSPEAKVRYFFQPSGQTLQQAGPFLEKMKKAGLLDYQPDGYKMMFYKAKLADSLNNIIVGKDPSFGLMVVGCTVKFLKVTGVSQSEKTADVSFEWTVSGTPIQPFLAEGLRVEVFRETSDSDTLGRNFCQDAGVARSAVVHFQLYDDGWRMKSK